MKSEEIRKRFLSFFEKRGHTIIPSAPLVPENDPSVLFNTAGMQPLVPYLMGQKHPTGNTRLVDVQKCVRTGDIDEIGDNTHCTYFEMLGNWSLGDYFKKEAIEWSYEFLISKEEGLALDVRRLYVTVFEGDENAPSDGEAYDIWKAIFISAGLDPEKRIFFMNARSNWWSPGDNGPCGPSSEMFYDLTGKNNNGMTKEEFISADEKQEIVEIWNDVFMAYEKKDGIVIGKLLQQNVDTGSGLERIVCVSQGTMNVYDTDLFAEILEKITELSNHAELNMKAQRIIADHIRAAVFLISDGVFPSNVDQGYIVRRLLRRAVRYADKLDIPKDSLKEIAHVVIKKFAPVYDNLSDKSDLILDTISVEEMKFRQTLLRGLKEFFRLSDSTISGYDAFVLFSTFGFPFELTKELALERNIPIDEDGFKEEMKKHQDLSRTNSAGKFKGGLAERSEKTTMLHTATHLMLAGLRKYLGEHVHQAGSNITEERSRFDFTHPEKVSRAILDQVENYVNEALSKDCTVVTHVMAKADARTRGVEGSFWEKYPDQVTVYKVQCNDGTVYSQELCGGPHVENTKNIIGVFKIKKEESSSAGVRRVKAVLE